MENLVIEYGADLWTRILCFCIGGRRSLVLGRRLFAPSSKKNARNKVKRMKLAVPKNRQIATQKETERRGKKQSNTLHRNVTPSIFSRLKILHARTIVQHNTLLPHCTNHSTPHTEDDAPLYITTKLFDSLLISVTINATTKVNATRQYAKIYTLREKMQSIESNFTPYGTTKRKRFSLHPSPPAIHRHTLPENG